jgi:hypothetical protein
MGMIDVYMQVFHVIYIYIVGTEFCTTPTDPSI